MLSYEENMTKTGQPRGNKIIRKRTPSWSNFVKKESKGAFSSFFLRKCRGFNRSLVIIIAVTSEYSYRYGYGYSYVSHSSFP